MPARNGRKRRLEHPNQAIASAGGHGMVAAIDAGARIRGRLARSAKGTAPLGARPAVHDVRRGAALQHCLAKPRFENLEPLTLSNEGTGATKSLASA